MTRKLAHQLCYFSVATLLFGLPAVGLAQTKTLQEVVVTAQKRAERQQDVPVSISVLTNSAIVGSSLSNLSALATQVSGVQFTASDQGGGNADFYIRGIGQNDFIPTDDPGVGVYVDGVFIARTAGGLLDLDDVDRVEVLRGPQGTLFGMNTIGGAISVITEQPQFKFTGSAFLRAGQRDRFDTGLVLNVPVIDDKLAVRFDFLSKSQDGYGRSLETNRLYGGEGKEIGRLSVLWLPTDSVSVDLSADYTRVRQPIAFSILKTLNTQTFVTIPQNQWAVANGVTPYDQRWISPSNFTSYGVFQPGDHEDIYGTSLTVQWSLGATQLKSITAYRNARVATGLDFSAAPSQIGDQTVKEQDSQTSQEFILSGKSLSDSLDWIAGLYYLRESIFSDIYLPLSFPQNPVGYDTDSVNTEVNKNYAAYTQETFHVTNRLAAFVGGRYSSERKQDSIQVYATKFGAFLLPPTPLSHSWGDFTYRAGLKYNFSPNVMGYGSVATGFKSGGFNGRAQSSFFIAYNPEKATTYEIGLKSQILHQRLQVNADAYWTNYTDIQTTENVVDPSTGVETNVVGNPGDAHIKGIELGSTALLTNYLKLSLATTQTSAHYVSMAPGAVVSLSDHLPLVPAWTMNAALDLTLPAPTPVSADGYVTVHVDAVHKASYYDGAPNSQYNFEPHLTLMNARIAYNSGNDRWTVAAYARNLTNHSYYLFHEDLMAFVYSIADPAPPREIGAEVYYRW